jgi:hypothetical protein
VLDVAIISYTSFTTIGVVNGLKGNFLNLISLQKQTNKKNPNPAANIFGQVYGGTHL